MSASDFIGPILFARSADSRQARLTALLITRASQYPALQPDGDSEITPEALFKCAGYTVWRYELNLQAARQTIYRVNGKPFPVCTDLSADLRLAYVSCNGQEYDDMARDPEERNRLWQRLLREHHQRPFALMLHGGDQLYADEIVQAHDDLIAWKEADLKDKVGIAWSNAMQEAATLALFKRYLGLYSQPGMSDMLASVPSIMMWDDHDIFDGWGSHPEALLDSPVGRGLFGVARKLFLLFQQARNEREADAYGVSLTHSATFPRLTVLAADLRTERRPDTVMGARGWQLIEQLLAASTPAPRRIVMSSVPLLGPHLSWVEAISPWVPPLRRFENDLRDQWQSRAHRAQWQRLLRLLDEHTRKDQGTTVVSGEIHLATRGEMPLSNESVLHQLVASGISHTPPPGLYARAMGWLASLGEAPLPSQPIRLRPLPGQARIYAAERNYLVLERRVIEQRDHWTAHWELEHSGTTAALGI